MDGLRDAVKKGMILGLSSTDNGGDKAPGNPVLDILRKLDTSARLHKLSEESSDDHVRTSVAARASAGTSIASMANTLLNTLSMQETDKNSSNLS